MLSLNSEKLIKHIRRARSERLEPKSVIVGPLSYLPLTSTTDHSDKLEHLDTLIELYLQRFNQFAANGVEWVQVDEPILTTDLHRRWQMAFKYTYEKLAKCNSKLLLTNYFGDLRKITWRRSQG